MFTGIVEHQGTIESLSLKGDGGRVVIHTPSLTGSLGVSNSIAVNGCCLTIVALGNESFTADLSGETIRRTSFGAGEGGLKQGARINLEQPLTAGKEFGGHFVLGHVDGVGHVTHLQPEGESWSYGVQVPEDVARFIVPKGSITIDGISLTVAFAYCFPKFTIVAAIIPYTYANTNICNRKPGDAVNLESDVLGKYVERHLQARDAAGRSPAPQITLARLAEQGF